MEYRTISNLPNTHRSWRDLIVRGEKNSWNPRIKPGPHSTNPIFEEFPFTLDDAVDLVPSLYAGEKSTVR